MDLSFALLCIAVLIGLGLGALFVREVVFSFLVVDLDRAATDLRSRRRLETAERLRIHDVSEGERVRLVGTVEPQRLLEAPFTGRDCVSWRVVIQQARGGADSPWHIILDEESAVDFFLNDGEQPALVRAGRGTALLDSEASFATAASSDASPELEAFLASRGRSLRPGWGFRKKLRYREAVLAPGEVVAAVGVGRWEVDPEGRGRATAGYRDTDTPMRLVLESPAGEPLLFSDVHGTKDEPTSA